MPNKATERTKRYEETNCIRISIKYNRTTDAPILAMLDLVESKAGYIKRLIREDIARNRPELLELERYEKDPLT